MQACTLTTGRMKAHMSRNAKDRLAIVEALVAPHGGTIDIRPGKGSHYRATLTIGTVQRQITIMSSAVDHRANKNYTTDVKRLVAAMLAEQGRT